jgi:hypothetical protein
VQSVLFSLHYNFLCIPCRAGTHQILQPGNTAIRSPLSTLRLRCRASHNPNATCATGYWKLGNEYNAALLPVPRTHRLPHPLRPLSRRPKAIQQRAPHLREDTHSTKGRKDITPARLCYSTAEMRWRKWPRPL